MKTKIWLAIVPVVVAALLVAVSRVSAVEAADAVDAPQAAEKSDADIYVRAPAVSETVESEEAQNALAAASDDIASENAGDSPAAEAVEEPAEEVEEAEPTEAPTATEEPEAQATPIEPLSRRVRCTTPQCQAIEQTYGLEGIYGYFSDAKVERLQKVLDAYADLLGAGDRALGQIQFKERVSGEGGVQYIEFVEELRSGRRGPAYARFAPDAPPELGQQDPDTYAIWCPADQLLGLCAQAGIAPGSLLVDVTTSEHLAELERTIAHELTHALDTKSGYEARERFHEYGADEAAPTLGNSLQEQFAEVIAQWLFPRSGDPAQDWDPIVGDFIRDYLGPGY